MVNLEDVPLCYFCKCPGKPKYTGCMDLSLASTTKQTWDFSECPQCQLLWLNPRIPQAAIGQYYSANYGQFLEPIKDPKESKAYYYLKALFNRVSRLPMASDAFWPELEGLPPGRVLDFGCGTGRAAQQFKKLGWEYLGLEPSAEMFQRAQAEGRTYVKFQSLKDIDKNEDFDLILLNHVIEHLYDPQVSINKLTQHLNKNGKMLLSTPNLDSLYLKLFKKNWACLHVPYHTFIFNSKHICQILTSAGLKNTKVSYQLLRNVNETYVAKCLGLNLYAKKLNFRFLTFKLIYCFVNIFTQIVSIFKKSANENMTVIATNEDFAK